MYAHTQRRNHEEKYAQNITTHFSTILEAPSLSLSLHALRALFDIAESSSGDSRTAVASSRSLAVTMTHTYQVVQHRQHRYKVRRHRDKASRYSDLLCLRAHRVLFSLSLPLLPSLLIFFARSFRLPRLGLKFPLLFPFVFSTCIALGERDGKGAMSAKKRRGTLMYYTCTHREHACENRFARGNLDADGDFTVEELDSARLDSGGKAQTRAPAAERGGLVGVKPASSAEERGSIQQRGGRRVARGTRSANRSGATHSSDDENVGGKAERNAQNDVEGEHSGASLGSDDDDARNFVQPGDVVQLVRWDSDKGWHDFCSVCAKDDHEVMCCDFCPRVYHLQCLSPPLHVIPLGDFVCPECHKLKMHADVHRLVAVRRVRSDNAATCSTPATLNSLDAPVVVTAESPDLVANTEYLVKWMNKSYMHCSWVHRSALVQSATRSCRLRIILNKFDTTHIVLSAASGPEKTIDKNEYVPIELKTASRVIAEREVTNVSDADNTGRQFLIKWKGLGYEECTWEDEALIPYILDGNSALDAFKTRGPICVDKTSVARTTPSHQELNCASSSQPSPKQPAFLRNGPLKDYQLEGVNWLQHSWKINRNVILGDEMGLGKTIQALSYIATLHEEGCAQPHLIVAPLTTLSNWEHEIRLWVPHINAVCYHGSRTARAVIETFELYASAQASSCSRLSSKSKQNSASRHVKFHVLLTSYEMCLLETAFLQNIMWATMIVDEGHRLKNRDSKLFQALITMNVKQRILLTGTPLQNSIDELFMLLHFLEPDKFSEVDEFQTMFANIGTGEQVEKLHAIIGPHLLRRMKKDVQKQLPPRGETLVRCELSPTQKKLYKVVLARNYDALSSMYKGRTMSLNNIMMQLRKVCGHTLLFESDPAATKPSTPEERLRKLLEGSGKLAVLDKMLHHLKGGGHRVLIYSQFVMVIDVLHEYMVLRKWQFERLDGRDSHFLRMASVERFNAEDSASFVFLLSTRAGGQGINLATADTVIMYDSDWNPQNDLQAFARAHRIGQMRSVMVYYLVSRATIEERMIHVAKEKRALEKIVVASNSRATKTLSQRELDTILRYSADALFDQQTGGEIYYDEAAIAKLLDRSKLTKECIGEGGDDEDAEKDLLLEKLKVADYSTREEEADMAASPGFWARLIGDSAAALKKKKEDEFGRGKRKQKPVVMKVNVKSSPISARKTSQPSRETDNADFEPEAGNMEEQQQQQQVETERTAEKEQVVVDDKRILMNRSNDRTESPSKTSGGSDGVSSEATLSKLENKAGPSPLSVGRNTCAGSVAAATGLANVVLQYPTANNRREGGDNRQNIAHGTSSEYCGVPTWILNEMERPFTSVEFKTFVWLTMRYGLDMLTSREFWGDVSEICAKHFISHFPTRNPGEIDAVCRCFLYRLLHGDMGATLGTGTTSDVSVTEGDIMSRISTMHQIRMKCNELAAIAHEHNTNAVQMDGFTSQMIWHVRPAEELATCTSYWPVHCDVKLLFATVRHGYLAFMEIIYDPDYKLLSMIDVAIVASDIRNPRDRCSDERLNLFRTSFLSHRMRILEQALRLEYG